MRYVYLHGFASGPQSRKAQAFRTALNSVGVEVDVPDLAEGDFEHLTISGQLKVIERLLAGQQARFIGSSMGGYLAALYASSHLEVDRLVLLAPAFGFAARWEDLMGTEKMREWAQTGQTEVFHYAEKARRMLRYDLCADASRYPGEPHFTQPALIFHGVSDAVVPVRLSRQFAAHHPAAHLTELDSDHELLNVMDYITSSAIPFLLTEIARGPTVPGPISV